VIDASLLKQLGWSADLIAQLESQAELLREASTRAHAVAGSHTGHLEVPLSESAFETASVSTAHTMIVREFGLR
jgi:hypothetical protein